MSNRRRLPAPSADQLAAWRQAVAKHNRRRRNRRGRSRRPWDGPTAGVRVQPPKDTA